jgi:UDP-N-acetylmuramate dehydrogenase
VFDVTRADLAPHTTLRLGGPADRLVTVRERDDVVQFVREAGTDAPLLLLAGGSNVVIADDGFPGTAALLRTTGVAIAGQSGLDEVLVTVEAGQPWDDVVALAVTEGLAGIECLSGIPGSAGATPIQNVGAYGQEVAETITSVRAYDRVEDRTRDLTPAECRFGYRTSRFKHHQRFVVLAVTFRLRRTGVAAPVRYAELARTLDIPIDGRASMAEVRAAVLALRAGKGMVLDATDPDTFSVGSFFTNPVLDADAFDALRIRAQDVAGTQPAAWPGADGAAKVSAAWLIERAGFGRGYDGGHRGVSVSSKHTLALTNRGAGSTAALLALAREIVDGVEKAFGVRLQPEPVLVNCSL